MVMRGEAGRIPDRTIFQLMEEEEVPAEPLVLGALLQCEYGARPTFLYVETDDININALLQACVGYQSPYQHPAIWALHEER